MLRVTLHASKGTSQFFLISPLKSLDVLKQEAYEALNPQARVCIVPDEYHFYNPDGTKFTSVEHFRDGDNVYFIHGMWRSTF